MKRKIYLLLFIFMFSLCGLAYAKGEKNYVAQGRVGNSTVGFIDFPEQWANFYDPNAGKTAIQISKTPFDIITLDFVPNDGNLKAAQGIKNLKNHFINMGVAEKNINLAKSKVNSHNAEQMSIVFPDGRELIIYLIDYNKKVYYIALEGIPKEIPNLFNVINNSWNPEK